MTTSVSDTRAMVAEVLLGVAPELAAHPIEGSADLRDELGLDSVDFLNFVIAVHEATGVDIPERDYPLVTTLDACVRYVSERT